MSKKEKYVTGIYLCLEMVLFLLIKWAEAGQPFFIYGKIEYAAIVLNFVILAWFSLRKKKGGVILLGLTVTLLADYYLTLTGTHFTWGVLCFFLVQLIYGYKLGYRAINVAIRIVLFLVFAMLMHYLGMPWGFCIPCALSICALVGNVICGFYLAGKKEKSSLNWIFAIGLLLFAGCDISLGLGLITQGIESLSVFHHLINGMVWIFYVPSQVLIVLTGILESTGSRFYNFTR